MQSSNSPLRKSPCRTSRRARRRRASGPEQYGAAPNPRETQFGHASFLLHHLREKPGAILQEIDTNQLGDCRGKPPGAESPGRRTKQEEVGRVRTTELHEP